MENKLKLYDEVELLVDLYDGVDYISGSGEDTKKGAIGTVLEIIDENTVLVEFSYKEYKDPVTSVDVSKLKLLNRQK